MHTNLSIHQYHANNSKIAIQACPNAKPFSFKYTESNLKCTNIGKSILYICTTQSILLLIRKVTSNR